MVKSVLSYPGAKQKIAKEILERVPNTVESWFEPFFGGGSITINFLQSYKSANTKRVIVADKYAPLINFWRVYQKDNLALYRECREQLEDNFPSLLKYNNEGKTSELKEKALEEGRKFFYTTKESMNLEGLTGSPKVTEAASFFLRNKISFSGTTDSGGPSDGCVLRFNYHRLEPLKNKELQELIKTVEFNCCDYTELFKQTTEKDFTFLDPPYFFDNKVAMYGKNRSTHATFNHYKFKEDIAESLKGSWLLTYGDRIKIRELYSEYTIEDLHLAYSMSRKVTDTTLDGAELFITPKTNKSIHSSLSDGTDVVIDRKNLGDWL